MNIDLLNKTPYKSIIYNLYLIEEHINQLNKDIKKCKSKCTLRNLLNDKEDCLVKYSVLLNLKNRLEEDF